jgi:CBS-domain-containing membrane protein
MVFSVYEQGLRINTPWEKIFPPRMVQQTTQTAASQPISPQDTDKYSQHPNKALNLYQQQGSEQHRKRVFSASQIMSTPPLSLPPDKSLDDAWQFLQSHRIRHLPVIDRNQTLLGISSERDILKASSKVSVPRQTSHHHLRLADVMNPRVLTAQPDTEVRQLADAMSQFHIGSILIVDEPGQVIGIVTRSDMLRTIMHRAPLELWT